MKVAVVGCGAAAEFFHLPALAHIVAREDIWLVDPDRGRALALARRFARPEHVLSDHAGLAVDAAVVAVPNDLHLPVAGDLLRRGIDVLCEKPLGRTAAEARAISDAALEATLAVGLFRRCFRSTARVRGNLAELGRPLRFRATEGAVYAWGAASAFALDPERAGGGVTIDLGPHVLDQLRLWLGALELRAYRDDFAGGIEADAELELEAGGVSGTIELSRTRALGSSAEIECERGVLHVSLAADDDTPGGGYPEAFAAQLRAFLAGRPVATGADGIALAEFVDACYSAREPLSQPWATETLLRA